MEAKNILDVEKFVVECNDMLTGKFLDLNKRLEKFLSVMTKSEDMIDFLSECLEDFNVEEEFSKAFSLNNENGNAKVTIPTDDKKRDALYVTIFNDITSDKLNSNQFLETYFQDRKMTPMQNFLDKIVKPFRDSVCKYFEIDKDLSADELSKHVAVEKVLEPEVKPAEQEEALPHIDEVMAEITRICNQILALLKFEKKHTETLDDVEFIVGSIIKMCEKKDMMVVNGLVIGLEYVAKKFKNIRHLVDDLTTLIYNYYEFLAGN